MSTTQTKKGLEGLDIVIQVRLPKAIKEGSKLLAFAQAKINESFVVDNIAVREGKNGQPFPSMPSYRGKDKEGAEEWRDIFFPITKEARTLLYDAVIKAYEAALAKAEDA